MAVTAKIYEQFANESELTLSVMARVAVRCRLTNEDLVPDLYEAVVFYTDTPAPEEFGSSDFACVVDAFEKHMEGSLAAELKNKPDQTIRELCTNLALSMGEVDSILERMLNKGTVEVVCRNPYTFANA